MNSDMDAEKGMWCDECGFTKNSAKNHRAWHALIQRAKVFGRYWDWRRNV